MDMVELHSLCVVADHVDPPPNYTPDYGRAYRHAMMLASFNAESDPAWAEMFRNLAIAFASRD